MNNQAANQDKPVSELLPADIAICLLTLANKTQVQQRLHLYADYLAHLLNGHIRRIELLRPQPADAYSNDPSLEEGPCELIVFGEPDRSLIKRLLSRYDKPRLTPGLTSSILIAREPRHPIKHILLILRAEDSDEAAVYWAGRLAGSRNIKVTCLPVIPAQPGLYHLGYPIEKFQSLILEENFPAHINLSYSLQHLSRAGVRFELKLHNDDPHRQIKRELAAGSYDLLIVASEPYNRFERLLLGELVSPLLHSIDRPILIAKPERVT